MDETIHLEPNQVPPVLRRLHSGNKWQVRITERMTVPADAGLWSGGSRDTYSAVRLSDGAGVAFPGQQAAPWDNRRIDRPIEMQPGIVVVCHTIFCGKDLGLRLYVHPADAAPMLPAPIDLAPIERLVLEYTASRKSSYNGMDRYQMAVADLRYSKRSDVGELTRPAWEAAKAALIGRGLLTKAGAITVKGRNAVR